MRHVSVLGCRVDALDVNAAVRAIVTLVRRAAPAMVVTLGTEMVVRAQRDPDFRDALNSSALSLCDTVGVLYAARAQGLDVRERVTGIDLLDQLGAALAHNAFPVFFLGGKGDTAARAAAALAARHPGLVVAGSRDGYFSGLADEGVAREVATSGARVVLVGLGSPRQEMWIAKNLAATGAAVGIGVGGSFDVLAGNVARAPYAWRWLNLEWFYRLVKEPKRWRRQLALPVFAWLALRERIATRLRSRPAA